MVVLGGCMDELDDLDVHVTDDDLEEICVQDND